MFEGDRDIKFERTPGTILTSDPKEREPDETEQGGDTLAHLDPGKVVVPIREGVERLILENRLAQSKEDLRYFAAFLSHYKEYEVANYDDIEGPSFKNEKILRRKVSEIIIEIENLRHKIELLSGLQIA